MNCRSYISGHYTTRDLNMDRGNSWPIYYDNKLLNGHLHNNCMLSSLSAYSEYDKEMLKRTMLEHEAIFRKQVHELHRLYRIQKDLMEEIQKNGLYRFSSWTLKSKTSFSSSEAQSQVTGKKWQIYNQPALSSSQSKETTTVTNTNVSPISTLQSCFDNGAPGRDGESNASFRAATKRMFDLQAPADVYIDAEGTERPVKDEIAGDLENDIRLTLANFRDADGGAHEYDSRGKNSLFRLFADLNEPIEDTSLGGTAYSPRSQPNCSLSSTSLWLQISSSKNQDFNENGSLPELEKELSQVCSQFLGEAAKSKFDLSLDSDREKGSMPFEPIQMSPIKANENLLEDLKKSDKLFVQKKDYSSKISRKSSDYTVSDEKLASLNINAPWLPAWMKPLGGEKQSSAGIQTMSSFDKSKTMNNFRIFDTNTDDPSGFSDKLQFCSDLRSSHLNRKFSHQNGFNHGFHRDFHTVSQPDVSYGNPNLNLRESCSFDIRDGITDLKIKETSKMDGECKELLPKLPRLENKLDCNKFLNLNQLSSSLDLCFSTSGLGNEGEVEIETPITSCNLEDFPSSLHCSEEKTQRNEVPDCSSREKIIGLPLLEKIQPNLNFLNERHQQADELQHDIVLGDINPLNKEKKLSGEKDMKFMNHIDLNCEVTFIDEPNISKMLAESMACVPSQSSDTLSSLKSLPLIDLDAPVMPPEENNTPAVDSTPRRTQNNSQEHGSSHDLLIEEAAESMITLSSDKFKHVDNDQSCLAAKPPCNTLHWFADVALLNTHTKKMDFEMDPFEQMTLQLEEMKPEATWCGPRETENTKDDEKNKALLLFKKPRRGQARKRRQRRDFQKDTLPGLATLSRKEMVEDLQLIGGLMKASGFHWEMSIGRRNGSRNGTPAKTKRRQMPRKTPISDAKGHSRPQKTLFLFSRAKNTDFEVERPGMVGWGRTTRRCRRPRCHLPQSVTTALT